MTARPLLFLDVDGVLNTYGPVSPPPGFTDHDLFPGDAEPVRLHLGQGAWIGELLAAVEMVWATAWNGEANRLLAPLLGIPRPFATLLITADPAIGLTRDAVERVLRWAAAL